MYNVPEKLLNALLSYIKETYLPKRFANPKHAHEFNAMDVKFFARGVAQMSDYFTSERGEMPKNYLNKKELLAGYLLYFVPTNFLKVGFCLNEVWARDRFAEKQTIKIADLGSGPGTASLACADHWRSSPGQRLEITAIDQNNHALHDAKRLMASFAGNNVNFYTRLCDMHTKNVGAALRGRYDIIIAANFFNEVKELGRQVEMVTRIIDQHLEKNGILIIIEPALRHTSRNLMKIRDEMSQFSILAPCMHTNPCPMLISSGRDWCHMYLDWERPELIKKIDMAVGNRKEYLKFAYVVLSGAPDASISGSPDTWRVVSAPMNSKGKTELLLCNGTCGSRGLLRVTRQDKDASKANEDFGHVWRGEIVSYGGGATVTKETPFKKIRR